MIRLLSMLCISALLVAPHPLFAKEKSPVCHDVKIDVRILRGTGAGGKHEPLSPRLQDLAPKLAKLPYGSFELVAAKTETVPIATKRVIPLSDGHKLTLRPLYVEDERIGMWMKWTDQKDMEIIDTRMHFSCDENMLTGLEENHEQGLLLAVKVSPVIGE